MTFWLRLRFGSFHRATEVVVGLGEIGGAIGIIRGFEYSGVVALGGGHATLPIAAQDPPGGCVGVICAFSIGIAFVEEESVFDLSGN